MKTNRTSRVALTAFLLLGAAGCDSLLEVKLPGRVSAATLENAALAATLAASVAADFECAYNNYTFGAAAHSDETWHSSGNSDMRRWAQRQITPDWATYVSGTCDGAGYGMWVTLHTARFQAEDNFQRITSFADADVPGKNRLLGRIAAYAGYTYTLLGEGFCEMTVNGGTPMQPTAVLAIAEEWFTRSIGLAQQAGDQEALALAYLGRARTRLNLERWTDAAADAQRVPPGFAFMATRSADVNRRMNKYKRFYDDGGHTTIAPGFRDLRFRGVPDPRVQVVNTGRKGFDNLTDLWISTKYPTLSSPIPLARWEEAQLIIAEAAARTGTPGTAVAIINQLHANVGLPPYDPVLDGPVLDQVFEERKRELFLEGGHRLNDMLRLGLPFFEGTDHIGQQYGSTTCLPLPAVER